MKSGDDLNYPSLTEVTPELIKGVRNLCWQSDRVCRGLESGDGLALSASEKHELKEFRRHLVNFSRARAFGLAATTMALTEFNAHGIFGDPLTTMHRMVMNGFYEAQHRSDPHSYVTSGDIVRNIVAMGASSSEKTLRTMLRGQIELGNFQELQTHQDQRRRHVIPSYETRLVFETACAVYCLCVVRFDETVEVGAHHVEVIAQMADRWLTDSEKNYFLKGKIPPLKWDNRVVGILDIEEGEDEAAVRSVVQLEVAE